MRIYTYILVACGVILYWVSAKIKFQVKIKKVYLKRFSCLLILDYVFYVVAKNLFYLIKLLPTTFQIDLTYYFAIDI